ncbi:MAG: hypothetical protein R3325_06545 [Thermoanaerobaculia bacterium]|nr:hypothetical protein [Thermoanaerobaculia bacterium]
MSLRSALLCLLVAAAAPAVAQQAADPPIRGIVVSCPRWGPIWGSPAMAQSLAEIRALGAGWAAIHPYAWIGRDGAVRHRPAAELEFLHRAVELAEEAGITLFWKPHLAYWGSFAWRGDIEFGGDQAAWRRFFDGYRAFIVDQARLAERAGVPLFAVGVELDKTTGREGEWRRIVRDVRAVYRGRLVYAANWDALDRVPFWDAVDLVGVHGYFPLATEDDPGLPALRRGWDGPLTRLAALSRATGKPVLFAEIGYNRSPDAARTPWDHQVRDTPAARELRRRLIRAAVERLEAEPWVAGMFWWKWIPGDARHDRDFSMKNPEAREALARAWGATAPARDSATAR